WPWPTPSKSHLMIYQPGPRSILRASDTGGARRSRPGGGGRLDHSYCLGRFWRPRGLVAADVVEQPPPARDRSVGPEQALRKVLRQVLDHLGILAVEVAVE